MKPGGQVVLAATARLYAPILAMLALSLLALRAPGEGVGVLAGLAFGAALALHAIVFGVAAAQRGFPPWLWRGALALGLGAAAIAAIAPNMPYARQIGEAGVFALTAGASGVICIVLFGRAPTLRESE